MYRKILVPLDGSDVAEAVLPHVEMLARANNSEVILLRVAVNPAYQFAMTDPSIVGVLVSNMEAETEAYLKRMTAQLTERGLSVSAEMAEGNTAECIPKIAEEKGADLIAMSTHGRSGVTRWLIGSVADRVVRTAKVPVLLVRPKPQN
jgi:nucleotide-binding universal stress UspA family protein